MRKAQRLLGDSATLLRRAEQHVDLERRGSPRCARRRRGRRSVPRRSPRCRRWTVAAPSSSMNAAVGPLTTSPPTSGLTATTGARLAAIASRMPGTARIGPIEMIGFDGPITIVCAPAIASATSGVGLAAPAPRKSTSCTGPSPRALIMNSCSGHHLSWASTRVRTGRSLIGSTRAWTLELLGQMPRAPPSAARPRSMRGNARCPVRGRGRRG